ncbi:hypothetical protein F4818DRAFT_100574 [Hypoxylon cercidicola]|nr:hypothetical protein F4818DRAFT_100574 [Hypoxylon cercidicola]
MAWGSKSQTVEAKPSTFRHLANVSATASFLLSSQLLPLLILLAVLGGGAFVGYQIYLGVAKIRTNAEQHMKKKNVVFTKDGLKVGVKHVEQERYVDATQSWVVKAWNMGSANPPAVKRK